MHPPQYADELPWFDAVILLRKFLMVVVLASPQPPLLQSILCVLINVVYAGVVFRWPPCRRATH